MLELGLRVDSLDDRILWRKLEFGRQLYNATLNTAFGLAAQMKQTKRGVKRPQCRRGAIATPGFLKFAKSGG